MDKKEKVYTVVLNGDNSLKQLFDRFYVIPKDYSVITAEDKVILEKYYCKLANKLVSDGKNGYIVFRGRKSKKLTLKEIDCIINDDVSTQRELAFKYDVSVSTINKVKKGKY